MDSNPPPHTHNARTTHTTHAPPPRQMDLMSVVEGLAQRQEAILQRLDALGEQVADADEARGCANNGVAMAWL